MLKGAGIHQNFGWKPVGKYDFTVGATSHLIDPLPCDFERTVMMISQWSYGGIHITINEVGANYSYVNQAVGLNAGAVDNISSQAGASELLLSWFSHPDILIKTILQKRGDKLNIISEMFGYTDATHFIASRVGGIYNAAGPYTQLRFINTEIYAITGQVEFFESVYGF